MSITTIKMADGLSLVLWSLAEYFNYFSVTLIVLCSALMTAFIVRLNNGEHWGHYHNEAIQTGSSLAFKKDVTAFSNPFFLKLSSSAASNLTGGVLLELSCLLPCEVHAFWGTAVNSFHRAILKTGTDFVDDLHHEVLLENQCLATDRWSFDTAGKHHLRLVMPDAMEGENFGPTPRQRYPCVVVMASTDTSCVVEHTTVVALVTILHLRDNHCDLETHIIAQYVKMAGQAVYNIKPLFLTSVSGNSDSADSQISQQTTQNHRDQCVSPSVDEEPETHTAESDVCSTVLPSTDNSTAESTGDGSSDTASPQSLNHPCEERGVPSQTREPGTACSDGDADSVHNFSSSSETETVLPECVVCQNQPLNCVLLPCRHACVCRVCFRKLDRCPMCRSHIESYFTLTDDDDDDDVPTTAALDEPVQLNLVERFERFNQRLNSVFGFE